MPSGLGFIRGKTRAMTPVVNATVAAPPNTAASHGTTGRATGFGETVCYANDKWIRRPLWNATTIMRRNQTYRPRGDAAAMDERWMISTVRCNRSMAMHTYQENRTRPARRPSLTAIGMLGMAALLLLMPANYRAGTDVAHPHAFFQEWLDELTGRPHTHAADIMDHHPAATTDVPAPSSTVSPFLAADIPLAAAADAANGDRSTDRAEAPSRATASSDTPFLTDFSPPLDQGSAIAMIGLLVAMLLVASARRQRWFTGERLTSIAAQLEPPPPRPMPCI